MEGKVGVRTGLAWYQGGLIVDNSRGIIFTENVNAKKVRSLKNFFLCE